MAESTVRKRFRSDNIDFSSTSFPSLPSSSNYDLSTFSFDSIPESLTDDFTRPNPRAKPIPFHKFVLIKAPGLKNSMESVSPFLVSRWVTGMVGPSLGIKPLRSGDLLVECFNHKQSIKLQSLKTLKITESQSIDINCVSHPSLNTSKGVIRTSSLSDLTEKQIENELSDRNVSSVRRLLLKSKDGKQTPTNTYFLTFDSPILPEFIDLGYIRTYIKPYIPNPLRCYKCQRFGHGKAHCNSTSNCANCGLPGHVSDACSSSSNCFNCHGEHNAFSKQCPVWIREKEITAIKFRDNISFFQARQLYQQRNPNEKTFAKVARTGQGECTLTKREEVLASFKECTYKDREWILEALKLKDNGSSRKAPDPISDNVIVNGPKKSSSIPVKKDKLIKQSNQSQPQASSHRSNSKDTHSQVRLNQSKLSAHISDSGPRSQLKIEREKPLTQTSLHPSNSKGIHPQVRSNKSHSSFVSSNSKGSHSQVRLNQSQLSSASSNVKSDQTNNQVSSINRHSNHLDVSNDVVNPDNDSIIPMEISSNLPTSVTKNDEHTKLTRKKDPDKAPLEIDSTFDINS